MTERSQARPVKKTNWAARIIFGVVALVVLVLGYLILAAFLPVWWATTVASQVQGNLAAGVWTGMFYGFVFTLIPLIVAWQATSSRVPAAGKVVLIMLAVALASPNLLTAAVLISASESAHNGQRILSTEATWFPLWTQISAAAAAVAFIAGVILARIWRQRGRKVKALQKAESDRTLTARNVGDDAQQKAPSSGHGPHAPSDNPAGGSGPRH